MKTKIVTDSSSNIISLAGVDFANVPLKIRTEQAEFVDDAGLDVESMVEALRVTKGRSGSSCPNVQEWLDAFGDADQVFAITITSNLSGSYASAMQAKADYETSRPGAKVCVIDSLSAGPELRLMAEFLVEKIAEGLPFEQIEAAAAEYLSHTRLDFSLQSLTNLARNGRVNPAVAKIAGVLGIRIVGIASDVGTLQQKHKCRGEKKAIEAVYAGMKERGFKGGDVRIAHCFNPESAQTLTDLIHSEFPGSDVRTEPCGGLCSFYAERGGMLVGYTDL